MSDRPSTSKPEGGAGPVLVAVFVLFILVMVGMLLIALFLHGPSQGHHHHRWDCPHERTIEQA